MSQISKCHLGDMYPVLCVTMCNMYTHPTLDTMVLIWEHGGSQHAPLPCSGLQVRWLETPPPSEP